MGVYEFDREDAIRFAQERGIKADIRGNELVFKTCPYCRGGDKRDRDTFAINLSTGLFNCKRSTCGEKGNMIRLHDDFGFSLGRDADAYYARKRNRRIFRRYTPEIREPAVIYMQSRGISKRITEKYHITTAKDNDNIIVFPFYDVDETMHFVKYRNAAFKNGDQGSKEWSQPNMEPILFGMDQCDPKASSRLVLTEGQIDSLSVAEAGIPNAVSVPTGALGFTWYPNCYDFLREYKELVVFGDHENGEITLLKQMQRRFNHGRILHVQSEDYKGCKDANELLQKYGADAVREAVNNAVPVISKRTIAMCDVRQEDDEAAEKFATRIDGLDKLIGGFRFGQLVILTGERGLGKSTLGSQFIAEAVNAGKKSYIYSGEMRNCDVKNWIERQFLGKEFTKEHTAKSGYVFYTIDTEKEKVVQNWYAKLLYMYNSNFDPEDEQEDCTPVIDELKDAIVNLGARVLLVDNLMIALESGVQGTDLNREQTRFVNQLSKLAKMHDALIILVAHPKKGTSSENSNNDDVSGSGHITDLANLVLKYTKPPKKEEAGDDVRVLQVLKNRLNGRVDYKGITLYYEPASKRISENKEFDWRYSWNNSDEDVFLDGAPDDLPF